MDGAQLAALVGLGQSLLSDKVFMNSMHFLWVYDYLLTLGDEINYAWSGKKSRVFALFIATRYTPVLYIVWVNVTLYHHTDSFCRRTKWVLIFHITAVTILAQIAVTLRIYAVTERKKLPGGVLCVMVIAQLSWGIYYLTETAVNPPAQLPEINLDAFKICFAGRWELGGLVFAALAISFDALAFSIIFVTARRPGLTYPGIPSLLNTILRDATYYFILMFACQLCLLLFLFFAPVQIKFMPGLAATMFVPIMASRLMLSLKKASVEPTGSWSLETMSNLGGGGSQRGQTLHFASRISMPYQISETLDRSVMEEEDIELNSVFQESRDRESRL